MKEVGHRAIVDAALDLEKTERTPVNNFSNIVTATSAGMTLDDVRRNPKASAECSLRYAKISKSDFVKPVIDSQTVFLDVGEDVKMSSNSYGMIKTPLVQTPEQIDDLALYDPFAAEECPQFTECYVHNLEELARSIDEDYHICGFSWGPVSMAGYLRGADNLLMDMMLNPDLAKKMISKTSRFSADIQRKCIEAGATVMWMSDPTASEDMISPDYFREFDAGPIRDVVKRVKTEGKIPIFLHMCGQTLHTMEQLPDIGIQCFSCDSAVDLSAAKSAVGGRMALMGNISPTQTLYEGTPEQVTEEAYRCIDEAGYNGGFILSSGCEVPGRTADANVAAMGKAGIEYWSDSNSERRAENMRKHE